ncbi:Phosphoadenosine phosphosulphate reductase [uncultured Caudovirales phage]|uniref:Phosphoadenosine phosphosulphate reductase n=1 Tax=uncultured Caudovirales phage TaxID=2100421 RepID=A0A6J5LWQ7_9CAUD|nr:Phosphoadenosine phosphosulphate reductase [uncultured Caudovirales phage]CAB4150705.1 Phosphoadenosine phosphosulphate reductase [uncultured Caudovirales phage]
MTAEQIIQLALKRAKRPAVLWSGGKDSTVLLDLAKRIRPDIEVIHFKLPFLPQKYAFHHVAQETYGMIVHDWVPESIALTHGKNRIDVCEKYNIGDGDLRVMRGTEPMEAGKPWVCGMEWLNRPKAKVVSDFDVLLCGHKSSDEDPLTGQVPLEVHKKFIGPTTEMWFPLREWNDKDISAYIRQNNVMFDRNRYDDNVVSKPDKHLNSDYVHACFNCVDKRLGKFVHCPKNGIQVENLHEHVLHEQPVAEYCNIRSGLQDLRSLLQSQVELAGAQEGQV